MSNGGDWHSCPFVRARVLSSGVALTLPARTFHGSIILRPECPTRMRIFNKLIRTQKGITMNRTVRALAIGPIAALLLAACGSSEQESVAAPTVEVEQSDGGGEPAEPVAAPQMDAEIDEDTEDAPANVVTGPGVYRADMWDGAVATLAVPGEPVEDIEKFREATGVDPTGYLIAEVDNTAGDEVAMLFEARVVDSEGETYVYDYVGEAVYDWDQSAHYDHMDEEIALSDRYPYSVDPTAKSIIPLVGPEVPEDIVSVIIDDSRAERVGDL